MTTTPLATGLPKTSVHLFPLLPLARVSIVDCPVPAASAPLRAAPMLFPVSFSFHFSFSRGAFRASTTLFTFASLFSASAPNEELWTSMSIALASAAKGLLCLEPAIPRALSQGSLNRLPGAQSTHPDEQSTWVPMLPIQSVPRSIGNPTRGRSERTSSRRELVPIPDPVSSTSSGPKSGLRVLLTFNRSPLIYASPPDSFVPPHPLHTPAPQQGDKQLAPQQANKQAYRNANSEEPPMDRLHSSCAQAALSVIICIEEEGVKVLLVVLELEVEVEAVKVEAEYVLAEDQGLLAENEALPHSSSIEVWAWVGGNLSLDEGEVAGWGTPVPVPVPPLFSSKANPLVGSVITANFLKYLTRSTSFQCVGITFSLLFLVASLATFMNSSSHVLNIAVICASRHSKCIHEPHLLAPQLCLYRVQYALEAQPEVDILRCRAAGNAPPERGHRLYGLNPCVDVTVKEGWEWKQDRGVNGRCSKGQKEHAKRDPSEDCLRIEHLENGRKRTHLAHPGKAHTISTPILTPTNRIRRPRRVFKPDGYSKSASAEYNSIDAPSALRT
ncbi:uncharacterized protein LACBIDRAFT_329701 [Laccaria bicolor S238N-H82]|uniref:Predicted protein n=1 Tax=Laccaria bicolor (strain S238N-H82 / ATCC MYA-4686) TaxID=486041 RepID=B0DIX3_LACBS|nr:uncharacterized protein LACBIDRAFT_329701 [Laccaria bicolor S238N-H82]EDR05419.1 predicted protein [Laccaria bicolor S238N-H82]|eukprot:XP_001883977.1 predicted protein [Laccaria bicolor S238N-H82]